ncbi:MAG TPA: methyltransferase domain-containing protein [Candidatus Acidoferrum sp.]|nr:methyltransferase domain-containing protein [Candidatus Acidoferrum sp.]
MNVLETQVREDTAEQAPDHLLTGAFRKWRMATAELSNDLRGLAQRYPKDRDVRFLLAEILHGAGQHDLALAEFSTLAEDCPSNECQRVRQGTSQCLADRGYYPAAFTQRLSSGEFANGSNASVWRDYAWREIQRGREIVRIIRQVAPLRGKRVLDVGSGYGGTLLSMAEQGAAVEGIEIDPERAHLGQQRIADLGMEIPYREGDICDASTCEQLGTFDVVVCQDVLEHVLDPTAVIESLCRMMRPGAIIYIQIPNKYGIDQLLSDHHYALTGITALSRPQAIEYWQHATGEAAEHYGVGYERAEKFYMSAFRRSGVTLNPVERYPSVDHVTWFAPLVSQMCTRLQSEIHPGLRPALQKRIRLRMTRVAQLYAHASEQIIALQNRPDLLEVACDAVVRRLCLGLWRFIGIKNQGKTPA